MHSPSSDQQKLHLPRRLERERELERKMEELILYGMWASPFCKRVELALKLKGISYSSVEEDLRNKSQELLQHNPVYKKVPVLVHKGKPIAESLVILEYIEDTWKDVPLLPQDPYMRSKVRFWAQYYEQTFSPLITSAIFAEGEEQEKGVKAFAEKFPVLEEGLAKDFSGGSPFIHGEQPGFLDVFVGVFVCYYQAFEEVGGVQLIDSQKNSATFRWLLALKDHPLVKETLPAHERLIGLLRQARARFVKPAKA